MRPNHRKALAIAAPHILANDMQRKLADLYAQYLAAFDLLGRAHVIEAAQKKTGKKFKLATTTSFADGILPFESVPFTQAIDRVLKLIGFSRMAFDGLSQRYKQQAFTIAGISDVKLIEQIKSALADVMASGGTEKDFQAAVNALTDQAGIARLSATQINTVFQTNVMTAYGNGRFEQMADPAVAAALPYWTYRTAGDDRVRPAHAALDGFTAKIKDPVWNRLYPPCGYNCRCMVTAELPDDVPDDADQPGSARIPLGAMSVPDPGFGGLAA